MMEIPLLSFLFAIAAVSVAAYKLGEHNGSVREKNEQYWRRIEEEKNR